MLSKSVTAGISALAVVVLVGACSSDDSSNEHDAHNARTSATATASDASTHPSAHNAADVMFAQMMIPHHQQALEMSDLLLAKDGVPTNVRELATKIKAAQQPEIAQLTGWLADWKAPTQAGTHHEMDGMLSPEDLTRLADAPGPEAAKLYLEQMIEHHEGAVDMAEDEVEDGKFPAAIELARSIISSQQAEIDQMKAMLAG